MLKIIEDKDEREKYISMLAGEELYLAIIRLGYEYVNQAGKQKVNTISLPYVNTRGSIDSFVEGLLNTGKIEELEYTVNPRAFGYPVRLFLSSLIPGVSGEVLDVELYPINYSAGKILIDEKEGIMHFVGDEIGNKRLESVPQQILTGFWLVSDGEHLPTAAYGSVFDAKYLFGESNTYLFLNEFARNIHGTIAETPTILKLPKPGHFKGCNSWRYELLTYSLTIPEETFLIVGFEQETTKAGYVYTSKFVKRQPDGSWGFLV